MAEAEPAENQYDKELEPTLLDGPLNRVERALRYRLWRLQRMAKAKDELETQRKVITAEAVKLQTKLGRPVMVTHPVTGQVQVAGIRADEILKVDAGELYEALLEHFKNEFNGDEERALEETEVRWHEVLKPREVETKDDGLFRKAVKRGRIPSIVALQVMKFEPKAKYIGFTQPKK